MGRSGTDLRSRVPNPPARIMAGVIGPLFDCVQNSTGGVDLLVIEIGEVADVETVEVDVFSFREVPMMPFRYQALEVKLAYRIAPASTAAPVFDAILPHRSINRQTNATSGFFSTRLKA